MRVFAIADPHLSGAQPKPMDIFGPGWEGHPAAFFEGWRSVVGARDLVLVPGDLSWAMRLEDALVDLRAIGELPGRKVILRGNHDYWWPSISRLRAVLPAGMMALQNDALKIGRLVIAGTRGWICPGSHGYSEQDEKIFQREVVRLQLSLKAAAGIRRPGDHLLVMLHFPPTNPRLEPSEFTRILEEAGPDVVVFGHVHGEEARRVIPAIPGVDVHFVAADALDFVPRLVLHAGGEGARTEAAQAAGGDRVDLLSLGCDAGVRGRG